MGRPTNSDDEWVIYGLSRRDGAIRYVGKAKDARVRLLQHLSKARNGHANPVCDWLRRVLADGDELVITILETGSGDSWEQAERDWISRFDPRSIMNRAPGGMAYGYVSPDARKRAGERLKSRVFTEEHRRRIAEAKRGTKRPDTAARNREEAGRHRGKKLNISDEERARRSAAGKVLARNLKRWNDLTAAEQAERAAEASAQMKRVWSERRAKNREGNSR